MRKGFGGCFSFLVLLVFIILALTNEKAPDIQSELIDTKQLKYSKENYIIKNRDIKSNTIYTNFDWTFVTSKLKRKHISIDIEVSQAEVDKAMFTLNTMLDFTISDLQITANYNEEPEEYSRQYWSGIYRYLVKETGNALTEISESLENIAINEKLDSNDLLLFCITMVQNIEYKIPDGELGIIPPIVSIAREYGDCDTISILLHTILEKMGYDTIIYLSRVYSHAMLGVYTNSTGVFKTYNGKPYYFLEVTNTGWGLGQLSENMKNLDLWYPIDL